MIADADWETSGTPLRPLLAAATALTTGGSMPAVLHTMLTAAVDLLDGLGGAVLRLDRSGLVPACTVGADLHLDDKVSLVGSPAFAAAQSREPVVTVGADGTATVAVPLVSEGELRGVLVVRTPRGRMLSQHDMYAVSVIAQCVAAAFHHALMVEEAKQSSEQLEHAIFHDTLTALPNRMLLANWTDESIARTRRGDGLTGILVLDIDGLRRVNEEYGHAVGDELLVAFVNRLRGCVRPGDEVARLHGDSFAVLLSGLDAGAVSTVVAERIVNTVNCAYSLSCGSVSRTATIGIALAGAQDAVTWESLIGRASLALETAKAEATGGYRVYDPSLTSHPGSTADVIDAQIADALTRGELVLRYQPVVSLEDGRVSGAEALVRWAHPDEGLLGPDMFIPAAVASGAIVEIGRTVLMEACAQLAMWQHRYGDHAPPWVSVNVSARQLDDAGFVDSVFAALAAAGLPGSALVLELTEDAVVSTDATVLGALAELRESGVRVAIDDFGSRYSSLGYLVRLPIDVIKVDKSFVDELDSSEESRVVVGAVVELAHRLGLATIAEGVEDDAQAQVLLSLGCRDAQGYRFARPLSVNEVDAVLIRGATPMSALIPTPRTVTEQAQAS